MNPRKHHFWSFLAITIAVCQIQKILTLNLFKINMLGWGYAQTYKFDSEVKILLKNLHCLSFLAITIAVCQIQIILTIIPLKINKLGWGYARNILILF